MHISATDVCYKDIPSHEWLDSHEYFSETVNNCNVYTKFINGDKTKLISSKCLTKPLVDFADCNNDVSQQDVNNKCLQQPLIDVYDNIALQTSTMVKWHVLEVMLQGYNVYRKHRLIASIKDGIKIPSVKTCDKEQNIWYNHKSATNHASFVSDKIAQELAEGRMAGPFYVKPPGLVCSPLSVTDKKESNSYRLLHDLSYPKLNSVNSNIPKYLTGVDYESLDDCVRIIAHIGKNCKISKTDIANAFRILKIHKDSFKFLGLTWENAIYIDTHLPMGCSISPYEFEELTKAIQWVLKRKFGVKYMSHLLDDFMFFGHDNTNECDLALKTFLEVARSLNIPIKASKTVLPTTTAEIHGILVDTRSMTMSLPPDKLVKAKTLINEMCKCQKASIAKIQSLVGFLNFCTKIVPSGRAFLRRLIDLTKGTQPQWFKVRITLGVKQDLDVWRQFLDKFNGKAIITKQVWCHQDKIHIFSDSSGFAFSGIMGNEWFYGIFPIHWKNYNIAIKEFLPAYLAMRLWQDKMQDKFVLFHIDNESVVYNLRNQTSKLEAIMSLMRPLVLIAMSRNVQYYSTHIRGKFNYLADWISRLQIMRALKAAPHLDRKPQAIPHSWLPWKPLQLN